jgi:hypothetical protein
MFSNGKYRGLPVGPPVMHPRVLRGGSWNNNRDNCRCAYRNRNDPGNRNNDIGFRVCVGPHIEHAPRVPCCHAGPGAKVMFAKVPTAARRPRLAGRDAELIDGAGGSRPRGEILPPGAY